MSATAGGDTVDVLVVGGGIVGLNLALEARRRHPDASVTVLEKEPALGRHASGRNSGVLHAGFYYASDTLKARFTREGNRRMKEYCRARGLPLNECGKLVVARDESELAGLDRLLERGRANGVELEMISAEEAREREPRVRTHARALWSPATATVDPARVMEALAEDVRDAGVEIRTGVAYRGREERSGRRRVLTDDGPVEAGYVINAAGVHADRVARDFGFSRRHRILPFKGLYLHSSEPPGAFRTNIYPVPDLEKTFLGVHFTVTADGRAKIGPTATPALWREHYEGLENFDLGECLRILGRQAGLFLRDEFGFRRLAWEETLKHLRPVLVRRAAALARGVRLRDYREWGRPGIRAQLLDVEEKSLVMDFRVEGDDRSFHVLNAISPGFTCSIPFREYCWDRIGEWTG